MRKRKQPRRGEVKRRARASRHYQVLKREWRGTENASYLARLERDSERVFGKFEGKGLKLFEAQWLAELHAGLFLEFGLKPGKEEARFREAMKTSFKTNGWGRVEGLAAEYLGWSKHPAKGAPYKETGQFPMIEQGFAEHLQARLGKEMGGKAEDFRFFQERRERPSLTKDTYLDAKVNLTQFKINFLAEQKMKEKKLPGVSPLWRPEVTGYFVRRLNDYIRHLPRVQRPKRVKEMRALIKSMARSKIEELEIMTAKEYVDRASGEAYISAVNEKAWRERYAKYLVLLAGEEYKRLGLRW